MDEIETLKDALRKARAYIDDASPDWHYSKIKQLNAIDAALSGSGAEKVERACPQCDFGIGLHEPGCLASSSAGQEAKDVEPIAWTGNWNGWRSIDTAPEDQHVILGTSGGHVGEAIMLIDEDTGQQKWAWALGPLHPNHIPYGWQPLPSSLSAPVLSDLRDGGFDGPTGAE